MVFALLCVFLWKKTNCIPMPERFVLTKQNPKREEAAQEKLEKPRKTVRILQVMKVAREKLENPRKTVRILQVMKVD